MTRHRADTEPELATSGRWRDTEPVRLYLYGLLGPGAALAVLYGLLSAEEAAGWLVVGASALGIGVPVVEGVRARVTPWRPDAPSPTPR